MCSQILKNVGKNMVFSYAKSVVRVQNKDVDVSLDIVKDVRGHCLCATHLNSGYIFETAAMAPLRHFVV